MNLYILILASVLLVLKVEANCRRYVGRTVTTVGDWSVAKWNLYDKDAIMKFDDVCEYTLIVGGLKPSSSYQWKVVIDNSWNFELGCQVTGNCRGTTDSKGGIRFKLNSSTSVLTSDTNYQTYDTNTCKDPYWDKTVRAVGVWNSWDLSDIFSVMTKDAKKCLYYLPVSGLEINSKKYEWKVAIGQTWTESFGCNNNSHTNANCYSKSDHEGAIRYVFDPIIKTLYSDYEVNEAIIKPPPPASNPIIPCKNTLCQCTNVLKGKLVRATGDWAKDAGSEYNWDATESLGLLTYDENTCFYFLRFEKSLKSNYDYQWKVTIDNTFEENLGCGVASRDNCKFKTNMNGLVRLNVDPRKTPPVLSSDYQLLS